MLILQPHGGMGDVLLSYPVIQTFSKSFPDKRIIYVVKPGLKEVAKAHPAVSAVFCLNRGIGPALGLLRYLKDKKITVACALWTTARIAWILRLAGIPVRIGQADRLLYSFLFTHQVTVRSTKGDDESHWVECLLDYPRLIGLEPKDNSISISPSEQGIQDAGKLLQDTKTSSKYPIAVVHAGKGEKVLQRNWPLDLFASIGDRLTQKGFQVLFTGGHSEIPLVEKICALMKSKGTSLAGKTNFQSLAAILKGASIVICSDSGPMHLAAATKTPVVGIFAMKKDFPKRWAPWQTEHAIIRPQTFPCRPWCSKETCPDFLCYQSLSPQEIVEKAASLAKKVSSDILP